MDNFFHFSLGQLCTFFAVIAFLWRLQGFFAKLQDFHTTLLTEHEMLIEDYCRRNEITPNNLPTRNGIRRRSGGIFG